MKKKEPDFGTSAGQTTWDGARIQRKITILLLTEGFFQQKIIKSKGRTHASAAPGNRKIRTKSTLENPTHKFLMSPSHDPQRRYTL